MSKVLHHVVPAKAGIHNHRLFMQGKIVGRAIADTPTGVMGSGFRREDTEKPDQFSDGLRGR